MRTTVWAVLVLGLAASAALGEDLVDNPQYKHWSAFKVGAKTKYQMTTMTSVAGQEAATKMTMTTSLKELTPEKAVVEVVVEMDMGGQKMPMPVQRQEIPAKVGKSAASQPAVAQGVKVTQKGEGEEEVTVGGKTYKTRWVEHQMSGENLESTSKTWTCEQVPGGMVKMAMETTKPVKSKTTTELVEFTTGG